MFCATPALISVLPMVLLFMSHVNILSVKSLVQSLPRGTEEKALWVRQMVVVKRITPRVVNMSSASCCTLYEYSVAEVAKALF